MSTVCKLDPSVRARRADRAAQLRALKADIRYCDVQTARGRALLAAAPKDAKPATSIAVKEQLTNLTRLRVISVLTLEHLTKLCKDPARTGESKDAVLAKLGEMTAGETVKTEGVFGQ
jgi:hypothetical protein